MSLTTAADPPFGKMARHASKLIDQLQKGYYNFYPGESWIPNVNLYETEEAYLVCVDLSGVDKEKIDLEVVDGQLRLKGKREMPMHDETANAAASATSDTPSKKPRVHLLEIDHGSFAREVELPQNVAAE